MCLEIYPGFKLPDVTLVKEDCFDVELNFDQAEKLKLPCRQDSSDAPKLRLRV